MHFVFLQYKFHVAWSPELKISKNQNALQGKNNTSLEAWKIQPYNERIKMPYKARIILPGKNNIALRHEKYSLRDKNQNAF